MADDKELDPCERLKQQDPHICEEVHKLNLPPGSEDVVKVQLEKSESLKEALKLHSIFHPINRPKLIAFVKNSTLFVIGLTCVLMLFLALLYGSQWNTGGYYDNISCAVSCWDGSSFCAVISAVLKPRLSPRFKNFNWVYVNYTSVNQAISDVQAQTFATALFFPVDFGSQITNALNSAVNTGSYQYSASVTSVINEAAQSTVASTYRTVRASLNGAFNSQLASVILGVMKTNSIAVTSLTDLTFIGNAVRITENNLYPVPLSGYNLATGFTFTMLFVYAIICLTVLSTFTDPLLKTVNPWHILTMRIIWGIAIPFVVTIAPTAIVACFAQTDQTMYYGFMAYWMTIFLVFATYVSIVVAFSLMGPLGGMVQAMFLMLNIASSDVLVPVILSPSFYKIGYALPMYNAVQLARTVVLGPQTPSTLGQNLGVLFGWFIVSKIISNIASHFNDYWENARKQRRALERLRDIAHQHHSQRQLDKPSDTDPEQATKTRSVVFNPLVDYSPDGDGTVANVDQEVELTEVAAPAADPDQASAVDHEVPHERV